MPIWTAERTISGEGATELVETQFPELGPVSAEPFGSGWDNTAFLINGEFIFRFPRRASSVALLEKEMTHLPQIASDLPLRIPHPLFLGEPSAAFDWPFAGYQLISGATACRANLNAAERTQMATKLGQFLRVLHTLPADDLHLPPDDHGTLDVERRMPKIEENITIVREKNLVRDDTLFDNVLSEARGIKPELPGCVVHADLYVRHFILDEDRQLAGIIDWGEMHRNDPAIDLALVFQFLPPGRARDCFWQEYGSARPEQLRLARFSALDHILTVLRYGSEIDDTDLIREGQAGVQYVLSPE